MLCNITRLTKNNSTILAYETFVFAKIMFLCTF